VKHKIYILDEHPVVIEGLKKILDGLEDIEVVGTSSDEDVAISEITKHKPTILIFDFNIKDRNGIDSIKKIKQACPGVLLLVFSMHDENAYAERCLRAGAMGYMMMNEPGNRITLAIRQVLSGGFFFSANLLSSIVTGGSLRGSSARGEPGRLLSDRQLEIFEMVGRGMDSHGIAEKLTLSSKTVDAHKANIRQKLGLDSARELLMEAVRWVEK
jgi:DNA-binding NarL/FixJ family response regulator